MLKNQTIVNLPLVPEEIQGPMDVNQCTAKQMQRWVRKGSVKDLFVGFIRRMEDEENSVEVEEKEIEEEKAFHEGMPEIIRDVLRQHAKLFPKIYRKVYLQCGWVMSLKSIWRTKLRPSTNLYIS